MARPLWSDTVGLLPTSRQANNHGLFRGVGSGGAEVDQPKGNDHFGSIVGVLTQLLCKQVSMRVPEGLILEHRFSDSGH